MSSDGSRFRRVGISQRKGVAKSEFAAEIIVPVSTVSTPPLAITLSSAYEYRLAGRGREASCRLPRRPPFAHSVAWMRFIASSTFAAIELKAIPSVPISSCSPYA